MIRRLLLGFATLCSLFPGVARADYARPPEDRYLLEDDGRSPRELEIDRQPGSTVRLFTGPGVKFADTPARGGLVLALDAGARGAGARFAGSWIRTGSDGGLGEYSAEVWIDFADRDVLHPILAAGAGLARLDHGRTDHIETDGIGVGVLRGTLQYRLPVRDVDARAALDVVGSVPAVGARVADATPWVTAALMVGIGL